MFAFLIPHNQHTAMCNTYHFAKRLCVWTSVLTLWTGCFSYLTTRTGVSPRPFVFDDGCLIDRRVPVGGAALNNHQNSRKISYDLGLGKNRPLLQSPRSGFLPESVNLASGQESEPKPAPQNVAAVQHWVDHDVFREQPPPLDRKRTASPPTVQKVTRKRRVVSRRRLVHTRSTGDDELRIVELSAKNATVTSKFSRSLGVAHTSKRQLNLNTPWVEMLIHEQQRKVSTTQSQQQDSTQAVGKR